MAGGLIGLPLTGILFSSAEKMHLGHLANFGISALLCLIALIYLVFFVNESIDLKQNSSGWSRLVDLSFPKEMLRTCFQQRPGHGRLIILLCAYVLASLILVLEGESQIGFLFARLRFGWDLEMYTMVETVLLVIIIIGKLEISTNHHGIIKKFQKSMEKIFFLNQRKKLRNQRKSFGEILFKSLIKP